MVLCRLDAPPWFCNRRIWKSSHVRKDTRLYFSDPYSNIQFMRNRLTTGSKFQFGYLVGEEVSLRRQTLEFSCQLPHDPLKEWWAVNSCNGLVCLVNIPFWLDGTCDNDNLVVCVCNPILGEWISIPIPNNEQHGLCALGFSAKDNQYKILRCIFTEYLNCECECEWKIYTLGTGHWSSIETKENVVPWSCDSCLPFNTFIHGSLHWANAREEFAVQSFNFETERFTVFSLPEVESAYIRREEYIDVELGVINDCLWASFHHRHEVDVAEMWAMKEYGDEKSWTMTLALNYRENDPPDEVLLARHKELVIYKNHICYHKLLFTLNGEELLVYEGGGFFCYNIKMMRHRPVRPQKLRPLSKRFGNNHSWVIAYNPSFVSLHDVGNGEQVIRGEFPGKCDKFGGYKCADCGSLRYKFGTRFNAGCRWPEGLPGPIDQMVRSLSFY